VQSLFEIVCNLQPLGKGHIWQIDRIRPARAQFLGERPVAGPQTGIMADAGQMDGERCSPPAGSQYRDLTNRFLLRALPDPPFGA
jgi:hypothetical protein